MIGKKLIFLACSLSFLTAKDYTIDDLVTMANSYAEEVLPSNNDYLNPDFTQLLRSQRPNSFTKIARFFGFRKDPFPINDFVKTMEEVNSEQKKMGRAGDYLIATQLQMNDKIIVFGSIQGALHSLVRDLQELVRQEIIDKNLKILNPRNRIIFNGTITVRSPYILQTLFIIALLIKKNPDNVFAMESDVEHDNLWKQYGMAEQLNIVYPEYGNKVFSLFNEFIIMSPVAFYGSYPANPEKLLKITSIPQIESDITEAQTGNFFFQLNNNLKTFDTANKEVAPKQAYATILIRGNFKPFKSVTMEPATFVPAKGGASIWQTFSAATPIFYKLYGFAQDSFTILVCGKSLFTSILEVYSRNRLAQDTFKLSASYEIDTGIPGKATREYLTNTDENIYVGCSLDLSKSNRIMGDRLRTGINTALSNVNKNGGIDSKKTEVQAIVFDDQYTPEIARENLERLKTKFNTRIILLPVGTPTVLAAEDMIESGDILVAFPVTGSPSLRTPAAKGVVNFRPSFEYEVEALLKQLIEHTRLKSFAFFFPEDEYGLGCMKKAKEVLEAHGITSWVELPYTRNTTIFDKQLQLLESKQVEALGCFSASLSTQEFLRQVGAARLAQLQLFALAWAVDDVLESFIKNELGLSSFLLTRDVPNPKFSTLPIVQEYRELMDEQKKPYDVFSLEAFICTDILCDAMKKINGPVTYSTLLKQLESIKDYNYKGLLLNFNPEDRQISKRTWLDFQNGTDWQEIPL